MESKKYNGSTCQFILVILRWWKQRTDSDSDSCGYHSPPSLSLLGQSEISIEQGSLFNDDGATASDNIDGYISSAVDITGEVDTNNWGEYTLTYNVSDSAGNPAPNVIRTVRVINDDLLLQVNIDTRGENIVDEPKILATKHMDCRSLSVDGC